ncbi:MAG: anthranilate synthase component I family protein [Planctomycetota bacterium]
MDQVVAHPLPPGPPLHWLAAELSAARWPILLDSGSARSELAQWSLLVFDPLETLVLSARPGAAPDERSFAQLQAALRRCFGQVQRPDGGEDLPAFRGGAVGWLSFDLGRELERLPERCTPDAEIPDLCMGLYPLALAEEVGTGRRLIVGRAAPAEVRAFAEQVAVLEERAHAPLLPEPPSGPPVSSLARPEFCVAVERIREHILDGDVYQVNLAQRFDVPWQGDPVALQTALRQRFPAPLAALLRLPGLAVVSSSPELFLRRRGRHVQSRPIKGTRPRGRDAAEDRALAAALESSPKEQAELAMIVDLTRNDLGRTACIGSVSVDRPFTTDAWSTVFHRVATVRAEIPAELPAAELMAAAFPPASVTGTPKIRALEVIESLEPVRRHIYTGAIGWVGADGDLDLSVAIRVATAIAGRLLVPVGSGITLASQPAAEYDETLHKARALFEVLGAPRGWAPEVCP